MTTTLRPGQGTMELPHSLETQTIARTDTEQRNRFIKHEYIARLGSLPLECLCFESKHPAEDTPLIYIPGFMETRAAVVPLARSMAANEGRHTIVYPPERKQDLYKLLFARHSLNPLEHQMEIVHQVAKTSKELTGQKKFDLAGHSLGNAVLMGVAYHELVRKRSQDITIRSGVSDAGVGLDTKGPIDGLFKMMSHFPGISINELWGQVPRIIEAADEDLMPESIQHMRDVGRALREAIQVTVNPGVQSKLRAIRRRPEIDFKYGALLPENDQFFYEQQVRRVSGWLLDQIVTIPDAYHVHANTDPDEHARYLGQMFYDLNAPDENAA